MFENGSANADKEQINNLMKSLSQQMESTLECARLTKVEGLQDDERQRRLANYATDYFRQTKIFLELNEKLKDYVYKVNYNSKSTGIVYEAQLEMMRDYCKVAFEKDIYDKFNDSTSTPNILLSNSESSFAKVVEKFNARYTDNKNSDKEVKFAEVYMEIDKQTLKAFYEAIEEGAQTEKTDYINSLTDEGLKLQLTSVFDYMTQSHI